jgi:DNA (cytosine-5)-methyltransferase 1
MKAREHKGPSDDGADDGLPLIPVAHALRGEGFDASEDGTGRGTPLVPVAFTDQRGAGARGLRVNGNVAEALHCAKGPSEQQAIAIQERAVCENPNAGPDGAGIRTDGAAYTLEARTVTQAVAFDPNQVTSKANRSIPRGDVLHTLPATTAPPHLFTPWAVRRLTPLECERLMGFPDGWTQIPYRNKPADACPDGPRYKALGNSWAVNCGRLIFDRMGMVEERWP